jgi:hypothetical protein
MHFGGFLNIIAAITETLFAGREREIDRDRERESER